MAHILLIEPDAVFANTYIQALELDGHTISWAKHAQDALDAADAMIPDIVVLELQLAGHSGIEFLYEFRSYLEWQRIPILVHTLVPPMAFPDMSVLKNELGVREYYYKPNTKIVQLLDGIHEYVGIA